MKVLVTGAKGFIGRNLCLALARSGVELAEYDIDSTHADLEAGVRGASVVYHLAGVNRPQHESELQTGNVDSLIAVLDAIERTNAAYRPDSANKPAEANRPYATAASPASNPTPTSNPSPSTNPAPKPLIVLSSSTQAELDNPYGRTKLAAEKALEAFSARTGTPAVVYRLPGVFGKWCRPDYNSVVATFCHNIANDRRIRIDDPAKEIEIVHVDDVIAAWTALPGSLTDSADNIFPNNPTSNHAHNSAGIKNSNPISTTPSATRVNTPSTNPTTARIFARAGIEPVFRISLGRLAQLLSEFRATRDTLRLPDLSDPLVRRLHSTYTSYLPSRGFSYTPVKKTDARGALAELMKMDGHGQIFVSRTLPGIVRGNHYHDAKVEKFMVLEGEAVIRFRHLSTNERVEYPLSGRDFTVVDIPPGWTHEIENVGNREMIVMFWSSEVFDPSRPDTYPALVSP